eukprot:4549748-Pyramimonas_sp.AAC.2
MFRVEGLDIVGPSIRRIVEANHSYLRPLVAPSERKQLRLFRKCLPQCNDLSFGVFSRRHVLGRTGHRLLELRLAALRGRETVFIEHETRPVEPVHPPGRSGGYDAQPYGPPQAGEAAPMGPHRQSN